MVKTHNYYTCVAAGKNYSLFELASIWDDSRGERGDVIGVRRGLADVRQRGLSDGSEAVGQRWERLL